MHVCMHADNQESECTYVPPRSPWVCQRALPASAQRAPANTPPRPPLHPGMSQLGRPTEERRWNQVTRLTSLKHSHFNRLWNILIHRSSSAVYYSYYMHTPHHTSPPPPHTHRQVHIKDNLEWNDITLSKSFQPHITLPLVCPQRKQTISLSEKMQFSNSHWCVGYHNIITLCIQHTQPLLQPFPLATKQDKTVQWTWVHQSMTNSTVNLL